jgi:tRNA (guanine-N7-)-methyltransferase
VEQITDQFAAGEVSEIWITFPDPRPKDRDIKRRLTSPRFLALYRHMLKPGGLVHLKTDNLGLYEFTLEVLQEAPIQNLKYTSDLYQSELQEHTMGIYTKYEKQY